MLQTSLPEKGRTLQSQRIYDQLRHDIAALRLAPGTVLNEIDLSEQVDASRTPLREALSRLRQEGFLDRQGRQLRVKPFEPGEVRHLYQFREALETMAVVLCVENARPERLDEIEAQLERYSEFDLDRDYAAFNEYVNLFHRSLGDACGNPIIAGQIHSVHDKVLVINARYWGKPHSTEEAYAGHSLILQAVRNRDADLARAAMRAHIRQVVDLFDDVLARAPGAGT